MQYHQVENSRQQLACIVNPDEKDVKSLRITLPTRLTNEPNLTFQSSNRSLQSAFIGATVK